MWYVSDILIFELSYECFGIYCYLTNLKNWLLFKDNFRMLENILYINLYYKFFNLTSRLNGNKENRIVWYIITFLSEWKIWIFTEIFARENSQF